MSTPAQDPFPWRDWTAVRYWPTWCGLALLWLLTRGSLNTTLAIGRALGPVVIRLIPGRRAVVSKNISLALPQADHARIEALAHKHAGMGALESAWLWFRGVRAFDDRLHFEGKEHLDAALASDRGVILLQAHFTFTELCSAFMGERWPASAVYDPPKNPLFAVLLTRFRSRWLTAMIPNRDIRDMVRRLRRGEMVWFSPDQAVNARHGGIPTRYFGQDVLTSSGTARIVAMTGAIVIPMLPIRSDDGDSYTLRFEAPLELDTTDPTSATQAVNDHLEAQVLQQPEQYLWAHKRFKPPSAQTVNPYAGIR